jgi:2-phosphosulfolactate phosphatase
MQVEGAMFFDQTGYNVCCEWGEGGVVALAPASDVIVIVDVLSFSTAIAVATERGAVVIPYGGRAESAAAYAEANQAILAGRGRGDPGYSLSPTSLLSISPGERLVLPSPNGSALTALAVESAPSAVVLAGCLRNAGAVTRAAAQLGWRIAVLPAGERWPADRSLRPAVEDLVGAGAIIARLPGTRSPEAEVAVAAYEAAAARLTDFLRHSSSGRELIERGFAADVDLAAQLDVSASAPQLINGAFVKGGPIQAVFS